MKACITTQILHLIICHSSIDRSSCALISCHERNVRQQNVTNMTERVTVAGPTDVNQLEILLPHLKLDMSLVLVLVQDCSLDLNLAVGSSQNRLAPSTPKSKWIRNFLIPTKGHISFISDFGYAICYLQLFISRRLLLLFHWIDHKMGITVMSGQGKTINHCESYYKVKIVIRSYDIGSVIVVKKYYIVYLFQLFFRSAKELFLL